MTATDKIRGGILAALDRRGIDFTTANEYGEPGYTTDKPILMANWNSLNRKECEAVERYFEIEWEDEWTTDDECRAFRTQADCYFWQPAYAILDGEIVGMDKIVADEDQLLTLIEENFLGRTDTAMNSSIIKDEHLEPFAVLVKDGLESGWYGTNDKPELAAAGMENFFFRISGTSQFNMTFQLWQLKE